MAKSTLWWRTIPCLINIRLVGAKQEPYARHASSPLQFGKRYQRLAQLCAWPIRARLAGIAAGETENMGEARRRQNMPLRPYNFRFIPMNVPPEYFMRLALQAEDGDKVAQQVITGVEKAIRTLQAPFSPPVFCGSCEAPIQKNDLPPAFIVGHEHKGHGFRWRPVCAACFAEFDPEEIIARFKERFVAEFPGTREIEPPEEEKE